MRRTARSRLVVRAAVTVLGALGVCTGLSAAAGHRDSLPAGLGGQNWTAIPTRQRVVALTFDCGGDANGVGGILATLKRTGVRVTVNFTGNFVETYKAQARAIVRAGERVGDHSVTHPYFTRLSDAQAREEVTGARAEIRAVTGADPWPWFRFPYGDLNQHLIGVVNSVGFVPISWTVDTLGWEGTSSGISVQTIDARVLANLRPGEIVLMHCGSNPADHSTLDSDALPSVIAELKARGYGFVTLDAFRGIGYLVLTAGGGVHDLGPTFHGSDARRLPGHIKAAGLAADPGTGGYWILKSNGGVDAFGARFYGSLAGKLSRHGGVAGIAAGRTGGYLILTSDGGVHNYHARFHGSDAHHLAAGTAAVGLAADPSSGGYWILKSNGGVDAFGTRFYGSLAGKLSRRRGVAGIAAGRTGGYLILTSDGGVHNYHAPFYGSDARRLPAGITAVGIAADPATGGYWILRSNGGVDAYNAPWYGSLAPGHHEVVGIAGE